MLTLFDTELNSNPETILYNAYRGALVRLGVNVLLACLMRNESERVKGTWHYVDDRVRALLMFSPD